MKKNSKVRTLFSKKQFLIVLSLVISVIMWLFVATSLSPDYTTTIYGVPVTVKTEGTSLEKLNLHLFDNDDKSINITITGKRYIVSQITKDDFTVSVPLSRVTGPGLYTLEVTPEYNGAFDDFTIIDYSDKTMSFYFDYSESKSFELETDISELNFAENYTADIPILSKNSIELTGSRDEIEKIERAVAFVSGDDVDEISQTVMLPANIILYDKEGKEYTPQNVKLSDTEVMATITVDTTKSVPLSVDFANEPAYFTESPLSYTITPSEIELSGNSEQLKALETLAVGTVDFEELDTDNTKFTFDIPLPEGITNSNAIKSCNVTFDLSEYKEIVTDISRFEAINIPDGIEIDVLTTSLNDVTVIIPKNLDLPSSTNLYAEIDIQNKDYNSGKYNVNVTIKSNTINKMWTIGSYKASIQVK